LNKENSSSQREQDIKQLHEFKNVLYDELVNPSLAGWFLSFGAFVFLVVGIPLQVLADHIIEAQSPLEFDLLSIPFELLYYAVPIMLIVVLGYSNIKFVATFNDRLLLFEEIKLQLQEAGEEVTQEIDVIKTQHYKFIIRIEAVFIFGTFFVACLWFLSPEHGRLEPLTIIYGFGTAIFEYFRSKLKIPNPLDRFLLS
jgi:hypothetical protein